MKHLIIYPMLVSILLSCLSCAPAQQSEAPPVAGEREAQLKTLHSLLRSEQFAVEMATWLDAVYYTSQGQPAPPFLTAEEEKASVTRSVRDEKIATNLAAFYAVESGIGVLSERTGETPVAVLESIVAGRRSQEDEAMKLTDSSN